MVTVIAAAAPEGSSRGLGVAVPRRLCADVSLEFFQEGLREGWAALNPSPRTLCTYACPFLSYKSCYFSLVGYMLHARLHTGS